MEYLFTYGTLQDTQVQEYIFGRILEGQPDYVPGFKILENAVYGKYALAQQTQNMNDEVPGVVYEITLSELKKADVYETSAYRREKFTLKSGKQAWIYIENSK